MFEHRLPVTKETLRAYL